VLRDAREIDAEMMAGHVVRMVAARRLLGLAAADDDTLERDVFDALVFYTAHYWDLWDARRECLAQAREFVYAGLDGELDLRLQIAGIDERVARLKRPSAIARWEVKRAEAAAELSGLQQERFVLHARVDAWAGLSGHAHDAAWWLALRAGLPEALQSSSWS
jgi:hypothetical protein